MLADGVHFVDGRAASMKQPRYLLLVRQGYAIDRRRQQGRATTREQTDAYILCPGRFQQVQNLLRPLHPLDSRPVGARGSGSMQANPAEWPHALRRHIHHAFEVIEEIRERILEPGAHGSAGFPSPDHQDAGRM